MLSVSHRFRTWLKFIYLLGIHTSERKLGTGLDRGRSSTSGNAEYSREYCLTDLFCWPPTCHSPVVDCLREAYGLEWGGSPQLERLWRRWSLAVFTEDTRPHLRAVRPVLSWRRVGLGSSSRLCAYCSFPSTSLVGEECIGPTCTQPRWSCYFPSCLSCFL